MTNATLATTEETTETRETTECPFDAPEPLCALPTGEEEALENEALENDAFFPDTADKVNWVLDKIATARARAARIRENAELMAKEADRDAAYLEWRFGAALQAFARAQLAEGTKKKSVRLEHGVIGFRTVPAKVTVSDEAAALAWAKANLPEAVTEKIDKKALSEALLASGEVVEFAQIFAAEETFYIK